jgi:hypothetical protein
MPTATAFEAAARSFDRAALDLSQLLTHTPAYFGPDTLVGGILSLVTELTIGTARVTANTAAAALSGRADICRARAEACRAFAADLDQYHREMLRFEAAAHDYDPTDPFALPPRRPTRPHPVADFIEI